MISPFIILYCQQESYACAKQKIMRAVSNKDKETANEDDEEKTVTGRKREKMNKAGDQLLLIDLC